MKPLENETQPQFAIRFHSEMASAIPDTVKRNKACFDAWDAAKGDDPTIVEVAEARFPADQYVRRPWTAHFHEHEVPEHEVPLPDGSKKTVPLIKYGRDELAQMVEGMNDRILDHDEFSPITRGHTGPKPGDKSGERQIPEVLGYAGPYRLGMIGRKNPRWAVFGVEYHRKEAVPELKNRVGRSPEVWRYARPRDRFFYPIATLAEEMPRLNLPPAHYARKGNEQVFVECYTAVMPGGSNTFVPSFQGSEDKRKPMVDGYSADSAPGNTPDASAVKMSELSLEQFMNTLFETQPFQFLFSLMQQSGSGGLPNPASPNPIPADPNAAPAAPTGQAGAPPATPPGGGAPAPGAPAAPAPAPSSPPPAEPVAAAAPPSPPAPSSAPAPMAPDKDKDKYSRPESDRDLLLENQQLKLQLEAFAEELRQVKSAKTRVERYSRLEELSRDYLFRPESELERTSDYSDEQFENHLTLIRDNYQRSLVNMPNFASMADPDPAGGLKKPSDSLEQKDVAVIEKYCMEHDVAYWDAKEIYVKNNRTFPVA